MTVNIKIEKGKIAALCRKWKITEFSLFGSVLRGDFRPDSNVDVLVTFAEDISDEKILEKLLELNLARDAVVKGVRNSN